VLEAASLLVIAWVGLRVLSYPTLRRLLDRYARRAGASPDRTKPGLDRIGWAVVAGARHLPLPMTCLVQTLAADAILRRRGFAARLRLGVRQPRDRSALLTAHAWVECEGAVVVGQLDDLAEYSVLAAPGRV
jgi:hypothetical protein